MPYYPSSLGQRQDLRFDVTFLTEGTKNLATLPEGAIPLTIRDISRSGCMVTGPVEIHRGERLIIRLPHAGYRDAFAIWISDENAGFQFERPLPPDAFVTVLSALGYRPLPLAPTHHASAHDTPASHHRTRAAFR